MKKVFILLQFGQPHRWTQQFIDNVQKLEPYGFYWQIYTPNDIASKGNVEVVNMNIEEFNTLVERKLGVNPKIIITPTQVPSTHVTDFNTLLGAIFEDCIRGFDYWGCMGWDVMTGRLDHFIPDSELEKYDVWTDDVNIINGTFCLFRNTPEVNNLYKKIADWQRRIVEVPCPRCMGDYHVGHTLQGFDEFDMTEIMKTAGLRYGYPPYYPVHSHDRLESQLPFPKLKMQEDGSLWELQEDVNHPDWIHAHDVFGREVAYYHFMITKAWPTV